MLTKKENFYRSLRNEQPERLVWAPNFDHWLNVNKANGTLPEEFRDMSRDDIVRKVGATIWSRTGVVESRMDGVKTRTQQDGPATYTYYETPVGTLCTKHETAIDECHTVFLKEHLVKKVSDLKPLKYMIESTEYAPAYENYYANEKIVGDDGIVLAGLPCMPFIQFAKTDAGYVNGLLMWSDYKKEVDEIIDAYFKKGIEFAKIAVKSPCTVLSTGDNMDQWTCPPKIFKEYAIPYYQELSGILQANGKILQGHWCGRTENLLELTVGSGMDVIEAFVTVPMSTITLKEALNRVQGKIVIQGGVPSVYMCRESATREQLTDFIKNVISENWPRRGFILGMADNVPPNADFERVRMISDIVNSLPAVGS